MSIHFTHETTVTITFDLPTHPEAEPERESTEINVRLHLVGSLGSPESGRFGPPENYDPGSPGEVEFDRFEIEDGQDLTGKSIWREPYKLEDATVSAAVDSWVEDHEDDLIQAMAEHEQGREDDAAQLRADVKGA